MDYQTTSTLLSWLVFTPLIGVGAILLLLAARPFLRIGVKEGASEELRGTTQDLVDNAARAIGLMTTVAVALLGLVLWSRFEGGSAGLQFVHHTEWIQAWNIEYFVGVDGLSITMVILTGLIFVVAALASVPWWGKIDEKHPHFSKKRVPGFWILMLLLEMGVIGTFCAQDMFLFYIFWEVMLLPMYFLIGIWGAPTRVEADGKIRGGPYAAIKFFLYTLAGSVFMLLAIIAVHLLSGDGVDIQRTFSIPALTALFQEGAFANEAIMGLAFSKVVFVLFFIGFAIKVPMFPFHTWLPDAHVDAPTPISVILAAILLKTGMYGILRFNFQMLADVMIWAAWVIAVLGVINIVYGAFVCMAQKDLKKLIAYSSISHMGFCLLGVASLTAQGVAGSIFQMVAHGVISAMLFLLAGVIYDRAHTREIEAFGGLAGKLPEYAGITGLAFMASLGLPGLAGFIGEVMVFLGAFGATDTSFRILVVIAALAVIITAAYYLWTMQRMFLGAPKEKWAGLWDVNWRERMTLYPLAAATVFLGVFPIPVFNLINTTLNHLLAVIPVVSGGG